MRFACYAALVMCACSSAEDALPPDQPEAGVTTTQDVVTFAIDSIQLGDRRTAY
jgi:hypothetical protein